MFGWISIFSFSKNIFSDESKIENNKISFLVEIRNLILSKIKMR